MSAIRAPASKTAELLYSILRRKNVFGFEPFLLGLTATPGRKKGFDIEDDKLRMMFDNHKFSIDTELMEKYDPGYVKSESEIKLLQNRKILSTFDRQPIIISPETLNLSVSDISKIKSSLSSDGERKIDAAVLRKISTNKVRNQKIIDKLIQLSSENMKTIFFACNVDHAKMITSALKLEGVDAALVLGETDLVEKRKSIADFKSDDSGLNFLINVGVLTTGFDAPNIDCVFISRPVSSIILYSQIIGRGIRGPMMGGKREMLTYRCS